MPELQLLRPEHAPALLAFERENRGYFAASVPDRGEGFFAEFDARFAQLLAWQADGTSAELGYRIARKAVGQGLATAAVHEVCELAAAQYGLTSLRAKATMDNPASRKVLDRNGFVAVGELTLDGKPAVSYIRELC
jgi:ribosomal-protein-alanine N-acetyltransferase